MVGIEPRNFGIPSRCATSELWALFAIWRLKQITDIVQKSNIILSFIGLSACFAAQLHLSKVNLYEIIHKPCLASLRNFTSFHHPLHGNCYTFNSGEDGTVLYSSTGGSENGKQWVGM